jgi:hypothetical protein
MASSISIAPVTWLAFRVTSLTFLPIGALPRVNNIEIRRSKAVFLMVPSQGTPCVAGSHPENDLQEWSYGGRL